MGLAGWGTIGLAVVAAAGDARADEPAPAPAAALPARSSVRRAMLDGDFAAARVLLDRILGAEISSAERAAAAELSFVDDEWARTGRPRAAAGAAVPPMPDVDADWQAAFSATRGLLLAGAYAEAAQRFDRLVGNAPDLVAAARASELRSLAREALPATPAPAVAAPPPPAATVAKVEMETRWYGWQTLVLDGVAIVTTPIVPALGVGIYMFAPPLVHVGHGRPLVGLGDFGLRVGAPLGGALAGGLVAAAADCKGEFCVLGGAAIGFFVGLVTAVTIDAAVLARKHVPVEKQTGRLTLVPIGAPRASGGFDLGLGGTF